MFNPENLALGGVGLVALTFGIVQFLKVMLGWEGKKVTLLSAGVGMLLCWLFLGAPNLPAPYGGIVTVGLQGLSFGLSASGFYQYLNRPVETPPVHEFPY